MHLNIQIQFQIDQIYVPDYNNFIWNYGKRIFINYWTFDLVMWVFGQNTLLYRLTVIAILTFFFLKSHTDSIFIGYKRS